MPLKITKKPFKFDFYSFTLLNKMFSKQALFLVINCINTNHSIRVAVWSSNYLAILMLIKLPKKRNSLQVTSEGIVIFFSLYFQILQHPLNFFFSLYFQILQSRKIFLLGCIQTVVESCMYIFVFLWTPGNLSLTYATSLPSLTSIPSLTYVTSVMTVTS